MISCHIIAQINLRYRYSLSGILCKKLTFDDFEIALIQEPWIHRNETLGLSFNWCDTFYDTTYVRPRSCIMISSRLKALLLVNYVDSDAIAIRIYFEHQEHTDKIIFMSAYLHCEEKNSL